MSPPNISHIPTSPTFSTFSTFLTGVKARELLEKTPVGFRANLRLRRKSPEEIKAEEEARKAKAAPHPAPRPKPARFVCPV